MTTEYLPMVFSGLFLAILLVLHFLKPELDPSWRMISEYEIGRFGWLMRMAFFCWGASVLSLLITIWPAMNTTGGVISRLWLVLIFIALIGAGIFKTNPITDTTKNLENTIHTICGAIVILTFPIAATLAVSSLLNNAVWQPERGWLIFFTILTWLGVLSFLGSIIVSRISNPNAVRVGPNVYSGWPNRFLAVAYNAWLIFLAVIALRMGLL